MAIPLPVRVALASVILLLGYAWVLFLFCIGAMLGIAGFVMIPFYLVAVPAIMSMTHDLASSVLRVAPNAGRLAVAHATPSLQGPAHQATPVSG